MSDAPPRAPNPEAGRKLFERFIKAFEESAKSTDDHARFVQALLGAVTHKENGIIAAIDDLSDEIRGLREDLRVLSAQQGAMLPQIDVGSVLGKIFGRR